MPTQAEILTTAIPKAEGAYGRLRLITDRREFCSAVGLKRFARLMRGGGRPGEAEGRMGPRSTDNSQAGLVAENLFQRGDVTSRIQAWTSSIAYIATREGVGVPWGAFRASCLERCRATASASACQMTLPSQPF